MLPKRFIVALSVLSLLNSVTALAQHGAKGKENQQILANGETNHGSGPESPGAGIQGIRAPFYRIQPSDTLELTFTFAPEFNQTTTVLPDGFLALRANDSLHVAGLTVPEVTAAIRRAYSSILSDTQVSIALKDFEHPFFLVTGEVGRPGRYELRGDTTLMQALAVAGGFTDKAKTTKVVLFREVSGDYLETRVMDVKKMLKGRGGAEDLHLRSSDLVYVPRGWMAKIERFIPRSNLGLYMNGTSF